MNYEFRQDLLDLEDFGFTIGLKAPIVDKLMGTQHKIFGTQFTY